MIEKIKQFIISEEYDKAVELLIMIKSNTIFRTAWMALVSDEQVKPHIKLIYDPANPECSYPELEDRVLDAYTRK